MDRCVSRSITVPPIFLRFFVLDSKMELIGLVPRLLRLAGMDFRPGANAFIESAEISYERIAPCHRTFCTLMDLHELGRVA